MGRAMVVYRGDESSWNRLPDPGGVLVMPPRNAVGALTVIAEATAS